MNVQSNGFSSLRNRAPLALRVVGDLLARMTDGESWEFAAFDADDALVAAGSSGREQADIVQLRSELRLQRIAGHTLPHIGNSLAIGDRRAVVVVLGRFGERVAIVRIEHAANAPATKRRDGGAIRRFLAQHADAIAAAIFDEPAESVAHAARRSLPLSFIVDAGGAVITACDDTALDAGDLRVHFVPQGSDAPPILRPVIADLLARHRGGMRGTDLIAVLPFAIVRLTPLRRGNAHEFLITVEWLRSRASLEATAERYAISRRELQVLAAMLRGLAVSEIAAELGISDSTVVFHLKRMLKKTSSRNRSELAARMLGWHVSA